MKIKKITQLLFFQSFKFRKNFLWMLLLDIAYYFVLLGLSIFMFRLVLPNLTFLFKAGDIIKDLQNIPLEQMSVMADQIKSSFAHFIVLGILFLVLWLATYSFFKGVIWSKVFDKGYTLKHFLKLCLINIIVSAAFVLLLLFTVYFIKDTNQVTFVMLFVIPISIHLYHTSNAVLFLELSLRKYFSKFTKVALRKIYLFILPYIIMAVMLAIVMYIVMLFLFLPPIIYYILYLLFFIVYVCWCKQYIGLVVKKVF